MRCLHFLALTCLAAHAGSDAMATTRPAVFADLADRARAQPAEFAADALLRIADAPTVTDVAWKREVLEDAFRLAAGAQQPFARRSRTGKHAGLFDKAYAQGLDACTLQCKAVHAMLAIDYKKARELFAEIPPPGIPPPTCEETLDYDPSIFYATAGEVAARAFSAKEAAQEEPFHLLLRVTAGMTSPSQVAPIARMLVGASLKAAQFEALAASFAGALQNLSGDADVDLGGLPEECARRNVDAQPLLEAWRTYRKRRLADAQCADAKPAGQCESPQCRQLAAQFAGLVMSPDGSFGLTYVQKSTPEWGAKLRQYLAALADWTGDDDPVEYFQFKSRFYSELFDLAPNGPERELLLATLLTWLQQDGYRHDHRAEWFYPVNELIVQAFADPLAMKTTVRELLRSADPVIALYAQLEQLLPRPVDATIRTLEGGL
jgi:hypothetical protein